jgi:preprotein translocase subunit SecA
MDRLNLPEDEPIQMGFVSKAVAEAQAKVEGANFDMRKHLLEYDDVLNKQRASVYRKRQEILGAMNRENVAAMIYDASAAHLGILESEGEYNEPARSDEELKTMCEEAGIIKKETKLPEEANLEVIKDLLRRRSMEATFDPQTLGRLLSILDLLWMNHLEDLEALAESVGLRAYGQRDPLVEYRKEASRLYKNFWGNFNEWIFANIFKLAQADGASQGSAVSMTPSVPKQNPAIANVSNVPTDKVGRNDPCPCGSGKKYKKCHGK